MARVDTTKAFLRPFASCREQLVGRVRQREEIVRRDRRRLGLRERGALCFEQALEIRPVAGMLTRVEEEIRRLGGLRLQRERPFDQRCGFFITLVCNIERGQAEQGLRIVGSERERALEARARGRRRAGAALAKAEVVP